MLKDDNGVWIEEVDKLKEMVNSSYQNLFLLNFKWTNPEQTNVSFPMMSDTTLQDLNRQITDEEVKHDIFLMKPWKEPRPDGFPVGFYQKSWSVVGKNVCDFVKTVWHNSASIGEVNKTDICLIPKVNQPHMVAQF